MTGRKTLIGSRPASIEAAQWRSSFGWRKCFGQWRVEFDARLSRWPLLPLCCVELGTTLELPGHYRPRRAPIPVLKELLDMRASHFLLSIIALSAAPLHAQNLVLNGDFGDSLIGWENASDIEMTAQWIAGDASGNSSSGSAQITNVSAAASNGVAIQQCVPVNSGQTYTYGGKVRIPSGTGQALTNKAVMSVRWYSGPDCTTPNGGSLTAGPSPPSFDVWTSQTSTLIARAGARSAHVRALVTKVPAGGSFTAQFDKITMTSPSIFQNGFD